MRAITFVEGVLFAAIIATWMWTWWWNRYVVTDKPEPDYNAAMRTLTLELVAFQQERQWVVEKGSVPLYAQRKAITRKVVDAANNREEKNND